MTRLSIILSVVIGVMSSPALAQKPAVKPAKVEPTATAPEPTPDAKAVPAPPRPADSKVSDAKSAAAKYVPGDEPYVVSSGEVKATPEMWFYEQQMKMYLDPKMAVRRAAEFRADQRRRQIAAMQWFGYSNLRPRVSPDPYNGDYAPTWTGNNSYYPNRWMGGGSPVILVRPELIYTH
jgi:hypothetical protein